MSSGAQHRKEVLERRAEHARQLADASTSTNIGLELESLASLYDDTAQRILAHAPIGPESRAAARQAADDGIESELMSYLRRKSEDFLRGSRAATDRKEADELRHLSALFGAEVARLRNADIK